MNATKSRTAPTLVASPAAPSSSLVETHAATLRQRLTDAAQVFRGSHALACLRVLALALISPRPINVLVIGPPGTGKTAMAGALSAWTSSTFLDVQFSPWTDVAELLGAVDLVALQAGRFERAPGTAKRPTLSNADVANFDEIPRGAPGIRAASLRPLAERRMPTGEAIPTHVIIATANTRLTSEEDRALVDRFVFRVEVPRLMNEDDLGAVMFREVTVDHVAPPTTTLAPFPADLVPVLRAHAATVDFPGEVAASLRKLALALRQPPAAGSGVSYPDVSERRWVLVTRALQATAALAGRSSVDWSDLLDTLPSVLDDGPETRAGLNAAIASSIPAWVAALKTLDDATTKAIERARRVGAGDGRPGEGDKHTKIDEEFDALLDTMKSYGSDVAAKATAKLATARDAVDAAYDEGKAALAARRRK